MQRSRLAIGLEVITTAAMVALVLYVLFRLTNHRCQTPAPRWADKNSKLSGGFRRTARRRPFSCGGFVFLFRSSSDDPDRIVRQGPLQRPGLISRRASVSAGKSAVS
jgi:hypothetical protein